MNWINAQNNTPKFSYVSSDLYLCVIKDRAVVDDYYKDTLFWNQYTRLWEYRYTGEEVQDQSSVLYYISLTDIPLPSELTGCSC